jgi:hypothetical protein
MDAMGRLGTDRRPETAQAPAYDLVVIPGSGEAYGARRPASARPDAGFLIQLLVSADPALRPARLDRTRDAAATYAEAARRIA